jgi:hypothetical protein
MLNPSLTWIGTGTSMKSDGVSEEFEETKGAIRIREMLRSCK